MKQIVCVHLSQWPIDRLRRRQSRYRHKPLVLIEIVRTKQIVAVVSEEAAAFGICRGMTLVQARALCLQLLDAPHEPQRDAESLSALARWMMQFSPTVSVELPDALFLDVTGSERLFGGWDRLILRISQALRYKNIVATTTMAPMPGAAWALAYAGCDRFIIGQEPLTELLADLPIESLRIDPPTVATLHRLGVVTCGQLLRLPRETLPCRFGSALLKRIDQALGFIAEPLIGVKSFTPVIATMDFEAEIESLEIIQIALRRLLEDQIILELIKRGCGAKLIEISFLTRRAPVLKAIQLSRPSRDAKSLFNLIRLASEASFSDDGFTGVRIAAKSLERLSDDQIALLEQEEHAAESELRQLIERLRVMAGEDILARPKLVESYIPERAYELAEPDVPVAVKEFPVMSRPPVLLSSPTSIGVMVAPTTEGPPIAFNMFGQVHRVMYAVGPERIAGRWWSGHNKTRDYFEVEDELGQRFWVFRVLESGKWFLHGTFD